MKLKWPGFNEKGSVIISLVADAIYTPKSILVLKYNAFKAKQELHVTLVNSKLGAELQDKIKLKKITESALKKTFDTIDWSYRQTGPVHILSREKNNKLQQSIITIIEMRGITEFYDQLKNSGVIDPDTPVPPPHITLYTHNCPAGISVPSVDVLNMLSVKTLTLGEFDALFKTNPAN